MRAILISTGDELTSGRTIDTNSAWLAEKLLGMGIRTVSHHTVGDDATEIASAIRDASGRADVVLVSGGLGPTPDDLTRHALADVLGAELVLDEKCLAEIEEFFSRRGRRMVRANRLQAMIPNGASPIDNQRGTAPGIAVRVGESLVICMPGVPAEMHAMFESSAAALIPPSQLAVVIEVLRVFGLGESDLAEKIADILGDRQGDVIVGTTVSNGLISLTISATGDSETAAAALAAQTTAKLARRLGPAIIGSGADTLASLVAQLLVSRKETLSLAESCTGGMVGEMITSLSGASEYFLGSAVCYANTAKRDILGVPQEILDDCGAVSEPVAREMAQGARDRFDSDWAVSLTGIAGPDGGSPDKPVGLVFIGLAGPDTTEVFRHVYASHREQIRLRAAMGALNHLRIALLGQNSTAE
ncbi:MAG: competence/damage-inducible protein A [Phycisphaerae bacterium]|nr:competence/damage-inducible protein A [Phycisphaerae bacterium]